MAARLDIKILVVDDMSTMRKLIKYTLMKIGFTNVQDADDGATALPLIQSAHSSGQPFDIILSDWNMPKMTGIDLLKNVRAIPHFKTLPFIIITGEARDGYNEAAIAAGVNYFMLKPVGDEDLREKINTIFS